MSIATINPATGETVKTFTPATDDEIEAAIARAHERFLDYRHSTTFAQRAEWANATADLLEKEADEVGAMMTLEMGKTLKSAKAEALKCAKGFRYYAENAEKLLADEPAEASKVGAKRAYTRYQPLGVVLAVMPWNFPLWQAVRFAAPALMAGNVGLLKHASNVPQSALYLSDVITRGGFPEGCFQTLLVSSKAVEAILRDPRVKAATLTGSEPAGQSVAAICGDEIKPTVMELGGSDPFIVMPSVDLDEAVKTAVTARVQNNGQSCIAAKRFIVHTDIYDAFVDKFVEKMQALKVGDPTDPDTDVGPLATESGRDEIAKQVDDAVAAGAKVRLGGKTPGPAGLVLPADGGHRHHQGHGALHRRGLRPGRLDVSRLGHRRSHRDRQRHHVRAGLQRLDQRRSRARALHRRHRGGPGLHQRDDGVLPRIGVRRRQTVGLWPRTRRPGHPRVLQRQDRLGRLAVRLYTPARAFSSSSAKVSSSCTGE